MKTISKLIFSLVLATAFFSGRAAVAHGNHFHSLAELAQHIRGHLTELEQLQAQPHPSLQLIQEECREIEVHARQYQEFARQIGAAPLEKLSTELMKSASINDLSSSILWLKKMNAYLATPTF